MSSIFSLPLLQAISDWQRDGHADPGIRSGEHLKTLCADLPDEFRQCEKRCYRKVALTKEYVWDLIVEDFLREKISSWTVKSSVAKQFNGGVPAKSSGYHGVIFVRVPAPKTVIVNLDALYRYKPFKKAMYDHRQQITNYFNGAGLFKGTEHEVVIQNEAVSKADIFALGGHSSTVDQLIQKAAMLLYQRPPTEAEAEVMRRLLITSERRPGPLWIKGEQVDRVLDRISPRVERLANRQGNFKGEAQNGS